ncbi:Soluble lytic murein transglycosylase [bacterium HR40]|nr:Soluble lytic murein transglycosylase [bacterium HR40]
MALGCGSLERLRAFWRFALAALVATLPVFPTVAAVERVELSILQEALAAAAARNWTEVERLAPRLSPPLRAYLGWRELVESDSQTPFSSLADFLERHPGWPDESKLRRLAEGRIGEDVPAERRLAFFRRFPPLTPLGRLRYAEALAATGRLAEARAEFVRAFPDLVLGPDDLRVVEARFGQWIDRELVARRVDRLLWQGRITEARALLGRLDDGRRRVAVARIALQTSAPNVDAAVARVPGKLAGDPGLAYDRLRWRLAKGLRERAREILLAPPSRLGEPARWWEIRKAEIRRDLELGHFRRAYELARRHGQEDGPAFVEAEWLAGWLALRYAGRPQEALERFERLYRAVGTPISRARAAYWAGRAAEALSRDAEAQRWYERAASYPTTFYGQLATDRLGRPLALRRDAWRPLADPAAATVARTRYDPHDERLAIARTLCRIAGDQHADDFFLAVASEVEATGAEALLAEVESCRRAHLYVVVAKQLAARGLTDHLQTFPLLDPRYLGEDDGKVDPALLIAIARQESHFAHDVTSRAGARGITQIMPATAREIAARAGLPFSLRRLEADPSYQIALARAHLAELLAAYDGSLELVAAAYNAGPGRVAEWLRRLGDPRRMSVDKRIDWIERIPFAETRNYVQRVIEGYRVYRQLLEDGAHGHPLLATGAGDVAEPVAVPRLRGGT